ncbi:uncharacterized protein LOC123274533 [Cotesia glomerata]|uniref:uncharacterized protein LOC123274533 n=1 Tax=Cotesia glomerata TaxID=32391 RepID=UPI001D01D86F|nr:uncharacterized protein LOC123274533 [Cotesia glomerata]
MFIIAAVIESLGLDIDKYNVSYSSIRNARISKREEIVDAIKKEEIDESCVVHWDEKMLPTGQGTSKAERLSIHISGISGEKFLEAPLLSDGTGISQASAVFQALTTRNICDNIKGMCFDTTASNTGDTKGACPLLEKKIGRDLLYLACRHHTSELMLRNVAEVAWPATNGPNVPIFKRFRDNWDNIDKVVYEIGSNDEHITDILNDKKQDILDFIDNQLKNHHPRDDYKELLELSSIFLGGGGDKVQFKAPGACHHARWLSKALYCLKIYLFRKQFKVPAKETDALRKICVFVVLFYVKIWFTAPYAIKAPNPDLQLVKDLIEHRKIHPEIANAALEKLSKHLWYLHEQLACLALFDNTVLPAEKLKIAKKINGIPTVKQSNKH